MKFYYLIVIALFMSGCVKQAHIEFTGTATGIKNGVFIVKTLGDSTIFGENIKDEKFSVAKKTLNHPGYYKMEITNGDNSDENSTYEVYLEDGNYTIETEAGKLYKYPKITSPSKIQEQLSVFYNLASNQSVDATQQVKLISKKLKDEYLSLSTEAYNKLLSKQQEYEEKVLNADAIAFKQFLKQYPQSDISMHILSNLPYEADPVNYYAIFKTLTPAAQNSDEGKEIGSKLSRLINLVAGKKAPVIVGNTPDGKAFDAKSINKKMIVVDFWRASNELSRKNHDQIKSLLAQTNVGQNVAFISVSLDTKADWWSTALKDDKLTWPQVCDLKGDDSPNAANYNITEIPTYYLLDGQWNIVVPNIGLKNIDFEISQYLKAHR